MHRRLPTTIKMTKDTVVMEIKLKPGMAIDPEHESDYISSFTALARNFELLLLEKQKLDTTITVHLK